MATAILGLNPVQLEELKERAKEKCINTLFHLKDSSTHTSYTIEGPYFCVSNAYETSYFSVRANDKNSMHSISPIQYPFHEWGDILNDIRVRDGVQEKPKGFTERFIDSTISASDRLWYRSGMIRASSFPYHDWTEIAANILPPIFTSSDSAEEKLRKIDNIIGQFIAYADSCKKMNDVLKQFK